MSSLFFLFFAFHLVFSSEVKSANNCPVKSGKCSPNEIHVSCAHTCQETCEEPFRKPCPSANCAPGCVCRRGLIREHDGGPCVKITKCPTVPYNCKHDRNSEFDMCIGCVLTCPSLSGFRKCNKPCIPGCKCKRGYVLDPFLNKCVEPRQCFVPRANQVVDDEKVDKKVKENEV